MKTLVFLLMLSQSSVFGAERPESGNCADEVGERYWLLRVDQKAVASARACRFFKSVGRHRNWSLPHAAPVRFNLFTATVLQRQQCFRSIP